MKLEGTGASGGVAIAKAFVVQDLKIKVNRSLAKNKEQAIAKVNSAIKAAIKEIEAIKSKAVGNLAREELAVFDAHITLAIDPALKQKITSSIENKSLNELAATSDAIDFFATMFASMDDSYMKARSTDVRDVGNRILRLLAGVKSNDLSTINEEVIIVAGDLTPSETALLDKKYVKGFVTNTGGRTSHAAIMARSLEIPAVLGLKVVTEKVKNNDIIALDGDTGIVIINPSKPQKEDFTKQARAFLKEKKLTTKFYGKESKTKDGHKVELVANIGSLKDLKGVHNNDAEGVGLFRSEFLYMGESKWPSEARQYEVYKQVLESLAGKLVVVRTLDIGGDKTLKYYKFPSEMNPFLGYRAIRLCLDQKQIFKTQLRALLRASVHGQLAIMFPMIATVDEFLAAKEVLEDCKKELQSKGVKFAHKIGVGMMMEVPSAAIIANQFAQHADFFSIGTNDLMQYTMAADRMNEKVSYLYQPLNPAVLNLINLIIEGAHKHGKWVGMCGEMASDPNAIPLLVGLGLDEFSMTATAILKTRRLISQIDRKKGRQIAQKALKLSTELEVKKLLRSAFN